MPQRDYACDERLEDPLCRFRRARRRVAEAVAKGEKADYDAVAREVGERDRRDVSREVAPLRLAPGAVVIDSTAKSTSDVLAILLDYMDILR